MGPITGPRPRPALSYAEVVSPKSSQKVVRTNFFLFCAAHASRDVTAFPAAAATPPLPPPSADHMLLSNNLHQAEETGERRFESDRGAVPPVRARRLAPSLAANEAVVRDADPDDEAGD